MKFLSRNIDKQAFRQVKPSVTKRPPMVSRRVVAIIVLAFLASGCAGISSVKSQASAGHSVGPLISANLVYAYIQGNSATFALNVTRLSDFESNSSITLVDVYCINTYIDGYLVGCLGLAFFSNGNLPMGGTGGPNIMSIVISVPAVNSETASPPAAVGQSAVQYYSEMLRTGALGMQMETPPPTMGNNSVVVEYVSSETFNQTMQLNYTTSYETVAQIELASSNGGYLYNAIYPSPSATTAETPDTNATAKPNHSPSTSSTPSQSTTPTPSPSNTATPSMSPTPTPSPSPTQQRTPSPSITGSHVVVNHTVDYAPALIAALATAVGLGMAAYFYFRKRG